MVVVTYEKDTGAVVRVDALTSYDGDPDVPIEDMLEFAIFNADDDCDTMTYDIDIMSDEALELASCRWDFDKKEFVPNEAVIERNRMFALREKRESLLQAFDIYKSNVNFGTLVVSEEAKAEVIKWYNDILDLNEDAINNPPGHIKNYL